MKALVEVLRYRVARASRAAAAVLSLGLVAGGAASANKHMVTRAARSTVRLGRKPGASPLLFGKFLMGSTAFVTLEDIADHLPSYEESVVEVDMDADLGGAYAEIEKDITLALKNNRGNRSLMSLMLHRLLLYPDHPFGVGEIWGKRFDPQEGRRKNAIMLQSRSGAAAAKMPRSAIHRNESSNTSLV